MMVAETDFYIADPMSRDNQIEFEHDRTSRKGSEPASPVTNDFVNPVFQRDSNDETSVRTKSSNSSETFYSSNIKYGCLCLQAKLLQKLNRPLFLLICMCFSGIAQGLVVTGVSFTVLTSIEKQFGLKSTQVALFGTAYDLAYGLCCIFVGYIGHVHKPRWIGLGLFLMAIGSFTMSIPKFIIGDYNAGLESYSDFCRLSNSTHIPHCGGSSEWYYKFIFITGEVLMGIGATPLYTLGTAHLDEITDRGQGSLYLGIYYASGALGPALGFIIGLPILDSWVDISQPADSTLTPVDRNWVGAWWIGYLVGAMMLLIPVVPMLGFPRLFPNSDALRARKMELEDTVEENKNLQHDLKSVWPATKALFSNPPFLFICLAISCESLAIGGFSTFISKFIETQFHFTASNSALYTGLIVIPGAAGGILLGGYLSMRFGWTCKDTLKASTIMAFIATLCLVTALVGCKGRDVVGSTERYYGGSVNIHPISLDSTCNKNCQCSIRYYKPICSVEDQKTYFSPCHAGCTKDQSKDKAFYNCTCFPPIVTKAVDGRCKPECTLFPLFAVGAFFMMFFTFMNNVPMLNATFRVVPEGQGSFAMGFQQVFVRFLGFVPAPTIFGKLIDESCKLWHKDECTNKTTSCLEYDNEHFRYYMFILGVVTKFLSFVFIFMAFKFYRLPANKNNMGTDKNLNGNVYNLNELPGEKIVGSKTNTPGETFSF